MPFSRSRTWGWLLGLALLGVAHSAALGQTGSGASASTPAPNTTTPSVGNLQPGHSYHGEAFNEGPRQRAYLMGNTGNVHFPATTQSTEAQAFIDQGFGQLHGFWYWESERSFRQAASLDRECAVCYLGMAMANVNNEVRAKKFIEEANKRKAQASPREQKWIDAYTAFYNADANQNKERRRKLVRDLEEIIHEFPDDLEAKAFLGGQIWSNSFHDLPIDSVEAIDALLREVLAANPLHPVHHYRIHLWDYQKPARALNSAAQCGQSSPGIAHMWHMPGHTYSHTQRFADACFQQEASGRVDHAYMIRDRILPDQIHNYAHNQEWLVRNLSYIGRVQDAVSLSKNLIEIPRHPKYNTLNGGSAQFGRARLLELLKRWELADDLIRECNSPYLSITDNEDLNVKRLRALAYAYYQAGQIERGRACQFTMEDMLLDVKAQQTAAGDKAEQDAKTAGKPEEETKKARNDAQNGFIVRVNSLEAGLAETKGHAAIAAGNYQAAVKAFEGANEITKEFLSRLHLLSGDPAKAEQLASEAVNEAAATVYPVANLADIEYRLGKKDEAYKRMNELRRMANYLDKSAPIFARLAPIAKELGWPEDWRLPPVIGQDVGVRPDLDSLGPRLWYPPAAPALSLSDATGQVISLPSASGKPTIVVFFLGFSCQHCVEQLKGLAGLSKAFDEAGISIVAVSAESQQLLSEAMQSNAEAKTIPYPILSDERMEAFRAFRAFDDFENLPLHGTFLIDGQGRLRWHDVGFQPFGDAPFLLEESKRLLSLP